MIDKIPILLLLIVALIGGSLYYKYRVPPAMSFDKLLLTDLNGKSIDISALKGKVVLLDFYKSWCGPCMGEMDDLGELSKIYSDDLIVLCISDEDIAVQSHVAKRFGGKEVWFYNTTISFEKLGIHTFPTNFILDKRGKVVYEKTAAEDWLSEDMGKKINGWITFP